MRKAIQDWEDADHRSQAEFMAALEATSAAAALDDWLSHGGAPPAEWQLRARTDSGARAALDQLVDDGLAERHGGTYRVTARAEPVPRQHLAGGCWCDRTHERWEAVAMSWPLRDEQRKILVSLATAGERFAGDGNTSAAVLAVLDELVAVRLAGRLGDKYVPTRAGALRAREETS